MLYEAIEEIDQNQVEAVTASGAGRGQIIAGGIGLHLQSSLNILAWPQVLLILIVIFVAVVISEWVSAKVRCAII